MDHTIAAIFDSGVFRPLQPVDLADGTRVQVQVPRGADPSHDVEQSPNAMSWSEFVQRTFGSCAGLGLQRHDQGTVEQREPIA